MCVCVCVCVCVYFTILISFSQENHICPFNFTSSSVRTTGPKSLISLELSLFHLQIFSFSIIFNRLEFMILIITYHI